MRVRAHWSGVIIVVVASSNRLLSVGRAAGWRYRALQPLSAVAKSQGEVGVGKIMVCVERFSRERAAALQAVCTGQFLEVEQLE